MALPRKSHRLKEKQVSKENRLHVDLSLPPAPQRIMTGAERNKLYRERRKNNQERYSEYLEKNKTACQRYRACMSDDQRKLYNERGAERAVKSKKRRAEEKASEPEKRMTRLDAVAIENQRAKWRAQKQAERNQMHHKTREAINARKRAAYAATKAAKVRPVEDSDADQGSTETSDSQTGHMDNRTPYAKRKALQRARTAIPNSPAKFAATVAAIIKSATPRKQHHMRGLALDTEAQHAGSKYIAAFRCLRDKNDVSNSTARRILFNVMSGSWWSASRLSRTFHVSRQSIKRLSEGRAGRKTNQKKNDKAKEFFEELAVPAPDKKLVSKKTGKPTSFLKTSLRRLHVQYKEAGGELPFSSFARCRPKNVRLMAQAQLRQCLCEYCANVSLKLQAIKAVAIAHRKYGCIIGSERDAVSLITCDPKVKECCYGTCPNCSVDQFDQHLAPVQDYKDPIKWHKWEARSHCFKEKQVISFSCVSNRVPS